MIKRNIKNFIFFFLTFYSIAFNVSAENKTVYIDLNFLVNESNFGKKILNEIEKENTKNLENLTKKKDEIKKLDQELIKVKNIITKEEFKNKSDNLKKKVKEFNIFQNKINSEFNKVKENQIKLFFETINPVIQSYMKEKDIDIIFDKKNIFIARSDYDITSDIIELINRNF